MYVRIAVRCMYGSTVVFASRGSVPSGRQPEYRIGQAEQLDTRDAGALCLETGEHPQGPHGATFEPVDPGVGQDSTGSNFV